jgi:hypothetical protein
MTVGLTVGLRTAATPAPLRPPLVAAGPRARSQSSWARRGSAPRSAELGKVTWPPRYRGPGPGRASACLPAAAGRTPTRSNRSSASSHPITRSPTRIHCRSFNFAKRCAKIDSNWRGVFFSVFSPKIDEKGLDRTPVSSSSSTCPSFG